MERIINFFVSGIKHQSASISNFFKNVLVANSSHMLTNVSTILKFLNVHHYNILELNKSQVKKIFQSKIEKLDWRCGLIQELLSIKDNQLFIDIDMDQQEFKQLLDYISIFR